MSNLKKAILGVTTFCNIKDLPERKFVSDADSLRRHTFKINADARTRILYKTCIVSSLLLFSYLFFFLFFVVFFNYSEPNIAK